MPSEIPYDPAIVLGGIVHPEKMIVLKLMAAQQAKVDAMAQELEEAWQNYHSLRLTSMELQSINVGDVPPVEGDSAPPTGLLAALAQSRADITTLAEELAVLRGITSKTISKLRTELAGIETTPTSPVDYAKSMIKTLPLAGDSINMVAQYFSYDSNSQGSKSALTAINSFVTQSVSFLGSKYSAEATNAVNGQINAMRSAHSIEGTLIITARCTHKDARLFVPLVLDPDTTIGAWNTLYPEDLLDPSTREGILSVEKEAKSNNLLPIVTGANFGSSFIGMVHLLKNTSTQSTQSMESKATSAQAQMTSAGWFSRYSGGLGIDASFATDVKSLMSSQTIQCHASLVVIGAVPNISANEVEIGVQAFKDFDPASMMGKLATLANSTNSQQESVQLSAEKARVGGQMMAIRKSEIQSVMSSLAEISNGKNKIIDVNTMMTAFEDFTTQVRAGNAGVPINYYITNLSKKDIAKEWVRKYFPQYSTISNA
jgi:hypothetical protein